MREIALRSRRGEGLMAMVDDDDYEMLAAFPWYALRVKGSRTIYARTVIDGKTVYMHNMVLPPQGGLEADHEDRNGLNNQRYNLRRLTPSANIQNSTSSDRAALRQAELAHMRQIRLDGANVHAIKSRGRTYYYHRKTRTRLPDDPASREFTEALKRLNRERQL